MSRSLSHQIKMSTVTRARIKSANSHCAVPVTKSALRGSHCAVPVTKSALRGSQSAAPATKSALRGSPSAAPAMKSALRGSPSAVAVRKSALRGSQSAAPATKSAHRGSQSAGSQSAVPVTKSALRGSASAAPATKSALRGSQSAVPVTKSALRGSQSAAHATKSAHRGSQSAAPATKSPNETHIQKSRFTAPVTKSELLDDHHRVQSAAPATNTVSKALRLPRKLQSNTSDPLHLSRKAPKHEVSLAPATKSDHHVQKCTRRHNESAVATWTHPPTSSPTPGVTFKTIFLRRDFTKKNKNKTSQKHAKKNCFSPPLGQFWKGRPLSERRSAFLVIPASGLFTSFISPFKEP